jgi:hypothetical protein
MGGRGEEGAKTAECARGKIERREEKDQGPKSRMYPECTVECTVERTAERAGGKAANISA